MHTLKVTKCAALPLAKQRSDNIVDLSGRRRETTPEVLERLFNEYRADLRAFLTMRMGGSNDVEDIIQEVFIRLAKLDDLPERLPPGRKDNCSYLFSVANNLAVDLERHRQVRRQYAERQEQVQDSETLEVTPESIALTGQQLDQVKAVLMTLRPNWRQAFVLNRFRYLSYPQIAVEMNVSVKQVEKYMKNALLRIRRAARLARESEPDRSGR